VAAPTSHSTRHRLSFKSAHFTAGARLGSRSSESAYTPCLLYELHARNLRYESVAAVLPVHGAQTLTYMRLTNTPAGLVINFNVPRLMDGVRRLLLKDRFAAPSAETSKGPSSEERS